MISLNELLERDNAVFANTTNLQKEVVEMSIVKVKMTPKVIFQLLKEKKIHITSVIMIFSEYIKDNVV